MIIDRLPGSAAPNEEGMLRNRREISPAHRVFADNDGVTSPICFLLFTLLFSTVVGHAQSQFESLAKALTVHGPFSPQSYQPLTGPERWHRWVNEDGAGGAIHVQSLGTAAYLQMIPAPVEWNRSWGGFARRVGSSYGGNLIQNSVHEGLATMEGTDPRYFACACKGFMRRSTHVVVMSVLTYTHGGHLTLDIPQIAGIYGSTMTQELWMPKHYSPLVQGVQEGHIVASFTGAEHFIQEFSPELKRFIHWRTTSAPGRP
jgi:hypothetical protein